MANRLTSKTVAPHKGEGDGASDGLTDKREEKQK